MEPTMITGIEELGIFEKDADAWAYSYDIAKLFDKRHDNVMASIERAMGEVSDDFNRLNFKAVRRKDKKGEERKAYRLNRKAFAYVVMGFTGPKAAQFKEAYIEAFERMTDLIFTRQVTAYGYKEMSEAVADCIGRDPLVFAEEANRVNKAVLGMDSREFKAVFHVPAGKNPRDNVPQPILEKLDKAQRLNGQLIRAGLSGKERERILKANYRECAA